MISKFETTEFWFQKQHFCPRLALAYEALKTCLIEISEISPQAVFILTSKMLPEGFIPCTGNLLWKLECFVHKPTNKVRVSTAEIYCQKMAVILFEFKSPELSDYDKGHSDLGGANLKVIAPPL